MKNWSIFGILFKKSLKDLKSNIKQFISIVFIIALAVCLFVGLQANYSSLKGRVDEFYKGGNIASYFLTYGLVDSKEEKNMHDMMSFDIETNKRMVISAKIDGVNVNIDIADTYPTVSKAYKLYEDGTSNEDPFKEVSNIPEDETDYFILDRGVFKFLNQDPSRTDFDKKYKANKSVLDISFSISSYKDIILGAFDTTFDQFASGIEDEAELTKIKDVTKTFIEDFFNKNTNISFKAKFSNYMLHPENIAGDSTSNLTSLMSRNRFIDCMSPIIEENINELTNLYQDAGIENSTAISFYIEKYCKTLLNSNNQLLIKVNQDRYLPDAKRVLDDYFNNKTYSDTDLINRMIYMTDVNNLVSNLTVANDIEQANDLSLTFPMIFLLVAVLIVITTISQLIIKERQQIGTFKALGLKKREIITHYLMTTISLAIIGLVLGMVIGPMLLPKILDIKYLILYSITPTSYVFPVAAALITAAAIIALVALITYLIVRKELAISPVESMRPATPKIKFKGKNAAKPAQIRFMSLKVALRNIKVYFTKSLMVVIGIMGCTGLLVCGFGVDDTLNYGVNHDLTTYFNYSIMTTYSDYKTNNTKMILEDPRFEGVFDEERCYALSTLPVTYYVNEGTSYSNTITILPRKIIDDQVYKIDFPENKVAISLYSADLLGLKVGDNITFKLLDKTYVREIGLVYKNFSQKSILIHAEDNIDGDVFANYSQNYNTTGYFNLVGDPGEERILEIVDEIKNLDLGIATCMSHNQTKEKINNYVSSVKLMTGAIKIFAILLAVICLINLALLNFKERTREIATMKVLGFSLPEIARSLIYEVLILTIVGSVIGLGLGFPLLYLILSINQNNYVSFIYHIEPISYIIGVALAIVTSLAVNIILSFFINKVPMVESLKSVE